jgi:hypothetical protein
METLEEYILKQISSPGSLVKATQKGFSKEGTGCIY